MPYRFNIFTGTLDYYETGGGGPGVTITGSAANFAALPSATGSGLIYLVLASSGVWLVNRKAAGLYQDTGVGTWSWLGDFPASYNNLTDLPTLGTAASKNVGTGANDVMAGDTPIPDEYIHPSGDGDLHVLATGTNNAGKVLTAGATAGSMSWETPATGEPDLSGWTAIANFTATPASTSTLTMGTDQTATIKQGMPLRYTIGGTVYYGQVSAITSNLLTVNGAPLSGDVTALAWGNHQHIQQIDLIINGYYEDAANTTLLATDVGAPITWQQEKAYCVKYAAYSRVVDTGATKGKATVRINNAEVNTVADGLTLTTAATWYPTVVDIATGAYDINPGESIEVAVTKGTNGDAIDLAVSLVMVFP